ncbi:hypothetical protein [Acetobacter pasteurianus]|uniref:Uncharacterized protein n=1 Tax=Acetobacter pasteurianus NBRC 3188 TaxID=1226663 RepID=A0A401WUR2_ACEPA|nr:hypothetical protein [Acetobacter pasteurianus]GCD53000.1 hypothetical protein NBRC3188_1697 [Acetobacter pasteurianus NBRC 3188]
MQDENTKMLKEQVRILQGVVNALLRKLPASELEDVRRIAEEYATGFRVEDPITHRALDDIFKRTHLDN